MKITKILFEKRYSGERISIPISDIPKEFLNDENNIMIRLEEGYNDSNGWNEGQTTLQISNYREQTEEEKQKMKDHIKQLEVERKERDRELYLKLKKEFENEI